LGFFEQMMLTDHFVYLDDVPYTKQDWRNRNRIKTPDGPAWLTVPVEAAPTGTLIRDIRISYRQPWIHRHLRVLESAYRRAPLFRQVHEPFSDLLNRRFEFLHELDVAVVDWVRRWLNINTPISYASTLEVATPDKTTRLCEICRRLQASVLYDGKAASSFIEHRQFEAIGVDVVYQDYQHPVYPQLWGEFVPYLSILDLLMNVGDQASRYILLHSSSLTDVTPATMWPPSAPA
jgi:hypothetical protein